MSNFDDVFWHYFHWLKWEDGPYLFLGYILLMIVVMCWVDRENLFLRRRCLNKEERKMRFLMWYAKKMGGDIIDIHICNGHWYFIYPRSPDNIKHILDVTQQKLPDNPSSVILLEGLLYGFVNYDDGFEVTCKSHDYTDSMKDYLYNLLHRLHKEEYRKGDNVFWNLLCAFVDKPRKILEEIEGDMSKKNISYQQDLFLLDEKISELGMEYVRYWIEGHKPLVLVANTEKDFYHLVTALNFAYTGLQNKWSVTCCGGSSLVSEDTGTCYIATHHVPEEEPKQEEIREEPKQEKQLTVDEHKALMVEAIEKYLKDDLIASHEEYPVKEILALSPSDFLIVTTADSDGEFDETILESLGEFVEHDDIAIKSMLPVQVEVVNEVNIDDSDKFVSCKLHYLIRQVLLEENFNSIFCWRSYSTSWIPLKYADNLNCESMEVNLEFPNSESAEHFRIVSQVKFISTLYGFDMPNPYEMHFNLYVGDDVVLKYSCGNMDMFSTTCVDDKKNEKSNAEIMGAKDNKKLSLSDMAASTMESLQEIEQSLKKDVSEIPQEEILDEVLLVLSKAEFKPRNYDDLIDCRQRLLEYTVKMYERLKDERQMRSTDRILWDFARIVVMQELKKEDDSALLVQLSVGSYLIYHNGDTSGSSRIRDRIENSLVNCPDGESKMPHMKYIVIAGDNIVRENDSYQDLDIALFQLFFDSEDKSTSWIEIVDYAHARQDIGKPSIRLRFHLYTDWKKFKDKLINYYGESVRGLHNLDVEWSLFDDDDDSCWSAQMPEGYFGSTKIDAEAEAKIKPVNGAEPIDTGSIKISDLVSTTFELYTSDEVDKVKEEVAKVKKEIELLNKKTKGNFDVLNHVQAGMGIYNKKQDEVDANLRQLKANYQQVVEKNEKLTEKFDTLYRRVSELYEKFEDMKKSFDMKLDHYDVQAFTSMKNELVSELNIHIKNAISDKLRSLADLS